MMLPPNAKHGVDRPKKIRVPSKIEFKRHVKCVVVNDLVITKRDVGFLY